MAGHGFRVSNRNRVKSLISLINSVFAYFVFQTVTDSGNNMTRRIQLTKENILNKIRFAGLFLEVHLSHLRMFAVGTLLKKRYVKGLFLLLIGCLLFSPDRLSAAEGKWFWNKVGEKVLVSRNSVATGDNFSPSVASSASRNTKDPLYLAVWAKQTLSGFDIFGARIDRDGKVLGEGDGEISICSAANDQMYPVVVWNGEHFLVVWQDHRSGKRWEIYWARVTPDGVVEDPDGKLLSKSSYDRGSPNVAWSGSRYLLAWQEKRGARAWNIYCMDLAKDLDTGGEQPRPVSFSLKDQVSPAVDFDGKNFMVVWQQKGKGNNWNIYGARIMPDQEPQDAETIQINESMSPAGSWMPVLSWNGESYLILWTGSGGKDTWYVYGRRVSADGEFLDPADVPIQTGGANKAFPALLWDGNQHLMIWEEDPGNYLGIYGASVDPKNWEFSSDAKLITSGQSEEKASFPALSIISNEVLVLWQGKDEEGRWQIFGQKLVKMFIGS